MQLSSLQENLKQGISIVGHIAGKNINLPILNNILLETKDGNIKMVATNLEVGVICRVRGKILEDGIFTVDAKIFNDYISLLPNKKINIKKNNNKLEIESDNYKTKISIQGAEDFPLIPVVEKKEFYSAKINDLKKAISQVIFAVSVSETRIELTGVFFDFFENKLILVATDSYRLAEKVIEIKNNSNNKNRVIIPAKTLQELNRIINNTKDNDFSDEEVGEIKFYISENQIMFSFGNIELVSRLIDGQYPDYKQIIPTQNKTRAVVNKNELIRAVKVAALFSKTGINDINLDFPKDRGMIVISAASGQSGENITELEANVNGDDNGIVVNYRYLIDGLNNIDNENIKIETIDSNTPCIIKSEKEDNYLYIVMPIRQ